MVLLYKILSTINLVGCMVAFYMLIQFIRQWKPPLITHACIVMLTGAILLISINQITTFITSFVLGWPLKFASTAIWIFTILFVKMVKTLSKKN